MGRSSRFSPEVRERAVRMVEEHREAHASAWAVLQSVAPKLGCTAETLRKWVRQAQRDAGHRPGLTTSERERLQELEREVRELKRANEIGLFKTEVIRRKGPWRTLEAVEFATLVWVDWFNLRRLLGPIGDIPPAEFEAQYYQQAEVA